MPRKARQSVLGIAALCLLVGQGTAESLVAAGYQEAVFSVSDAPAYRDFLGEVAGWTVLHEGPVDSAMIDAWGLPRGTAADAIVLGNPGTSRGFVRLIQFSGVEQQQIRSSAQSWDTGGWFDVNSRVLDMASKFGEFQAADWQATSDPVEFGFGPFTVKEWLVRGPDGIVFALIERVEPPLEGWPHLKQMSRLFNATQIVTDIDAAREFYIDKLGFSVYLDHEGPSREPGPNVLGLPHNLATEIPRSVTIVHPDGINDGSVELLKFDGAVGQDFSDRAVPPNLGILMLRFPVVDMSAFAEHVDELGLDVAVPVTTVRVEPYGEIDMIALRGPDGAWLEFYEERR